MLGQRQSDVTYGTTESQAHLPGIPGTGVKTGSIIARHVPFTTHQIVDVLAERRCRRRVSTTAEAKLVESDEILTC